MDPHSKDLNDPANRAFLDRSDLVYKIENTLKPNEINPDHYSGILFAGGHGTMWDFADNYEFAKISAEIYDRGGVVAAVCHGPSALINVKLKDGKYLIQDKKVTGFSNAEEQAAGLTQVMPFLLESQLHERGAAYTKAPLWQKHVVSDQRVVTGQNPASAQAVGQAVAKLLKEN